MVGRQATGPDRDAALAAQARLPIANERLVLLAEERPVAADDAGRGSARKIGDGVVDRAISGLRKVSP